MLRILNNLKHLNLETAPINSNSTLQSTVRWLRKPRKPFSLGTAKSKLFRVPARPKIPHEEFVEIQRLYNKYRTEMKTIKRFLTLKYNVENQQQEDDNAKRKEFEEDFAACMKLNDEWNAKQKVLRETRVAAEFEKSIELAKKHKLETEIRRQQKLEQREEIVRREKENSKDFILPEMLDAAIENALANPVDHNFALDLDGNKIYGRETAPEEKKSVNVKQ